MQDAHTVRGLTRLWRFKPSVQIAHDHAGLHPLVSRVMAARGLLSSSADAAAFLDPALNHLHEPSLIPGLDTAADRILAALKNRQRIVIYGDYDVDGVSATAILFHIFLALAPDADVQTYVPHRLEEGYGLNAGAIEQIALGQIPGWPAAHGPPLIVTVDCGVTAVGPAQVASRCGADLIITDHHTPPPEGQPMPEALAIVHPGLPGSRYPFPHLCGAGVAFKLAWRLATMHCGSGRVSPPLRALLLELLAPAALGAIADVVPLIGENRVIARFGLQRIKHSSLRGLPQLVEASGLSGENISGEHVGFVLGPRLNACGRMGHARDAVHLFTRATDAEASEIAHRLTQLNDQRRRTERTIAEQAAQFAEAEGMTRPDRRAIVLAHESWHAGVVGIVCSRLVERFGRPTILMTRSGPGDDAECHGSGRSIDGFNLHAALVHCGDLLTGFGGHDMAAGLRLPASRLPEFAERFISFTNSILDEHALVRPQAVDCSAPLSELTPDAVLQLDRLAPFGRGNPAPAIAIENLQPVARPEPLGKEGKHLAITARQDGTLMRFVAWNWGDRRDVIAPGARFDAVVEPKINTWGGRARVEPTLIDVRVR